MVPCGQELIGMVCFISIHKRRNKVSLDTIEVTNQVLAQMLSMVFLKILKIIYGLPQKMD